MNIPQEIIAAVKDITVIFVATIALLNLIAKISEHAVIAFSKMRAVLIMEKKAALILVPTAEEYAKYSVRIPQPIDPYEKTLSKIVNENSLIKKLQRRLYSIIIAFLFCLFIVIIRLIQLGLDTGSSLSLPN